MKFSRRYPFAREQESPQDNGDIMKGRGLQNCDVCGSLTNWLEINFQAPICGEACLRQMNLDYTNAELSATTTSEWCHMIKYNLKERCAVLWLRLVETLESITHGRV
jgi:hypothetical protein